MASPCFQVVAATAGTSLTPTLAKTKCTSAVSATLTSTVDLFSASSQKKFEYLTSSLKVGDTYWVLSENCHRKYFYSFFFYIYRLEDRTLFSLNVMFYNLKVVLFN
jgi:hypothetical protein